MNFINRTIKAGIFFIIPITIFLIILIKVFDLLSPLARLISDTLDPKGNVPFSSYIVAALIILLIFFIGGLIEKKISVSSKIIAWIELHILSLLPAYQLMKATTQEKIGIDVNNNQRIVLAPTDGWVLAILVEELPNDEVVVFIPGSPNMYEGTINIFKKDEIRITNISTKQASAILKNTGIGMKNIFEKAIINNGPSA